MESWSLSQGCFGRSSSGALVGADPGFSIFDDIPQVLAFNWGSRLDDIDDI